jgi:hypothetical protein
MSEFGKAKSRANLKRGGAPRKNTPANEEKRDLRNRIKDFTADNFARFEEAWQKTFEKSPETACKIYLDLMRYSLPVLSSIGMEVESKVNNTITETLIALRDGVISSRKQIVEDTMEKDIAMVPAIVEEIEAESMEEKEE